MPRNTVVYNLFQIYMGVIQRLWNTPSICIHQIAGFEVLCPV